MLPHLIEHAPSEAVRSLLSHVHQLMSWGALYDVFDAVLDHSDLLVAYPDDAQRQFAEAWVAIVQSIGNDTGHDAAAMYRRMVEVRALGRQGPKPSRNPIRQPFKS